MTQSQKLKRVADALRRLKSEMAVMMAVCEPEIRGVIGASNVELLKYLVREADEALLEIGQPD
jgi:hypothetical protein